MDWLFYCDGRLGSSWPSALTESATVDILVLAFRGHVHSGLSASSPSSGATGWAYVQCQQIAPRSVQKWSFQFTLPGAHPACQPCFSAGCSHPRWHLLLSVFLILDQWVSTCHKFGYLDVDFWEVSVENFYPFFYWDICLYRIHL